MDTILSQFMVQLKLMVMPLSDFQRRRISLWTLTRSIPAIKPSEHYYQMARNWVHQRPPTNWSSKDNFWKPLLPHRWTHCRRLEKVAVRQIRGRECHIQREENCQSTEGTGLDLHYYKVLPSHPRCKQGKKSAMGEQMPRRWGALWRYLHRWMYGAAGVPQTKSFQKRMLLDSWNTAKSIFTKLKYGLEFQRQELAVLWCFKR